MIALKEETVQGFADIYVEKRDGRRVAFDADKIYKALVKASQEVTTMTPLLEAKLEGITNKIVAEVISRFPAGVKIYEIQNIVEHELLNANEYAIAESYITYRTQRDFARSKATDINFTIGKLLNKDQEIDWSANAATTCGKCTPKRRHSLSRFGLQSLYTDDELLFD